MIYVFLSVLATNNNNKISKLDEKTLFKKRVINVIKKIKGRKSTETTKIQLKF